MRRRLITLYSCLFLIVKLYENNGLRLLQNILCTRLYGYVGRPTLSRFNRGTEDGQEEQTKSGYAETANAAATEPSRRRKILRSPRDLRSTESKIFPWAPTELQRRLGPATQTSSEGVFHLRVNPGGGPRNTHQSLARPAFRPALVSRIHSLSRNVARSRSGRASGERPSS